MIDTRDLRTRIETIQTANEILAYFVESYKAYVTTIEFVQHAVNYYDKTFDLERGQRDLLAMSPPSSNGIGVKSVNYTLCIRSRTVNGCILIKKNSNFKWYTPSWNVLTRAWLSFSLVKGKPCLERGSPSYLSSISLP